MARVLADDVTLNYTGSNHYLSFVSANVNDASGNNNGRLDPGETANLTAILRNVGGANFTNLQTTLSCASPYITITDNSGNFGSLTVDSIKENTADPYAVTVNSNCPQGHSAVFEVITTDGAFCDTFTFSKVVGSYHYLVWNPDATPSSGQMIHNTLTTNGYTGSITTNLLAEPTLEIYRAIFICCGVYPNNHRIVANGAEANAIVNYLNSGGRVWMEGGEVFYYDPQVGGHSFGSMFGLVGVGDGSGDMGPVVGVTQTFTDGMNFTYSGENSYMDRINASSGFVIFRDGNNSYNCGVAYNQGTYRTIGATFEFGSLVDGTGNSTKRALLDSIMAFFGITLTGIEEPGLNRGNLNSSLNIYPNPVKTGNAIRFQFSFPDNATASLRIYNTLGSCVKTIRVEKGHNQAMIWNGTDENNRKLPAGVYFINLDIKDANKITKRMVLID
jgi:hypothetical protein